MRIIVTIITAFLLISCSSSYENNSGVSKDLAKSWRENLKNKGYPEYPSYPPRRYPYYPPYYPQPYPQPYPYPYYSPEMDNPYYPPSSDPVYPRYNPNADNPLYPTAPSTRSYPRDNDYDYYFPEDTKPKTENYPLFFDQ